MQLGRKILRRLPAIVACWLALQVGAACAQDVEYPDAANPFIQDEPLFPPTPYISPLGNLYFTGDFVGFTHLTPTASYAKLNRTTTVLSGNDFDFANQPGMRMLLGARLTDYYSVELSYLGLFDWNDYQSVRNLETNTQGTQGNLYSPFTGFGFPAQAGLDYNNFVSIASETQLNTGELNFRRRVDLPSSGFQASGIWGVRYMSLADRFAYRSRSNSPTPLGATVADDVIASNRMFGAQVGGSLQMHVERRAWIDIEAKGIMFTNDSSQNTTFTTDTLAGGAATTTFGARSQQRVSFGVDLQAALSWRFSRFIIGRVGYQAIFLEGVSLAANNFTTNARNANVDPSELSNNGHMTFHGPFTGLTVTW
ncbi:MAG: hypothetical protein C0483_14895 [Pirellula sp.]|nr:hypothetical protein [Pirellula sp.]